MELAMIRLKRFLDLWLYYSIIKVWPIIMPQLLTNSRYVSMGFDDATNNYCVSSRI